MRFMGWMLAVTTAVAAAGEMAGADLAMPATLTAQLPGDETMDFVWIAPGQLAMGSPVTEVGRYDWEGPQHPVSLTQGYWLGQYEVTQAQWEAVLGTTPWTPRYPGESGAARPAVGVSWSEAQQLVQALNRAAGDSLYRLPTEAEWEYAGRAGTTTAWSFGDDEALLGDYAWSDTAMSNGGQVQVLPAGSRRPNPWGLYDMHGNVWEWVGDWYGGYGNEAQTDPTGPVVGTTRVVRGGGIFYTAVRGTRVAYRDGLDPDYSNGATGVRLLRLAAADANRTPRADAGPDQTVVAGSSVTLDGGGSSDSDGDSLSFHWSSPDGITLTEVTAARPGFTTSPTPGTYAFVLRVSDATTRSEPDTVVITTRAAADLPWAMGLSVTTAHAQTLALRLGLADGATDGLDSALGESELPPPPPETAFDARWLASPLNGLSTDYRGLGVETNGATWILAVQAQASDLPVTLAWDPRLLPSSGGLMLVDQATGGTEVYANLRTASSCTLTVAGRNLLQVVYSPAGEVSHTFDLPVRWSMVSLPCQVADPSLSAVFPTATSLFAFAAGYQPASALAPGTGYWVNLREATQTTVKGTAYADTALTQALPARWSMVGPGATRLDVAALQTACPALVSVYGYAGGYQVATTMDPGKAYWVNLAWPASLDLSGQVAAAGRVVASVPAPASGATLWAEGSGVAQALHLGVAPAEVSELPPLPPAGLFDARVQLTGGVQSLQVPAGEEGARVLLQGGVERLRWQASAEAGWELVVNGAVVPLAGAGQWAVTAGDQVVLRQRPTACLVTRLVGTYPNPFNPTTTIHYELAQAGPVRLRVYGTTGQLVRQLVATVQEAGAYEVTWDGRGANGQGVGNGVYLAELQVGTWRAVSRLVLLK